MAQVLKDDIRNRIHQAALEEFFQHGYHTAVMRNIAEKARIPTSLIYSYYKNKEALFDAILQPVLYDWEQVLTAKDQGSIQDRHLGNEIYGLSKAESQCLLNLFDHRLEFIILMDKSIGTKYDHEKCRIVQYIENHLNLHRNDKNTDAVLVHIIANNFVDGVLQIMYHYKGKDWAVMMLQKLSKMYLSGIGF